MMRSPQTSCGKQDDALPKGPGLFIKRSETNVLSLLKTVLVELRSTGNPYLVSPKDRSLYL